MKRIIVTLFVLLSSMSAVIGQKSSDKNASDLTVGAFVGLNIPQLTGGSGNPLSENWKSRQERLLALRWTGTPAFILPGVPISSIRVKVDNGTECRHWQVHHSIHKFRQGLISMQTITMNRSWIIWKSLLWLSITLSKSSRLYLDFGPYIGFMLNSKQKTSGSSIVYADMAGTQPVTVNPQTGQAYAAPFNADTDITGQINKINMGLTGGAGFTQRLVFGELVLDVRGAYGLSTIQHNPDNGDNHIGNLLVSLGYSIPLWLYHSVNDGFCLEYWKFQDRTRRMDLIPDSPL